MAVGLLGPRENAGSPGFTNYRKEAAMSRTAHTKESLLLWLVVAGLLFSLPAGAQRAFDVPSEAPVDAPASARMVEDGEPGSPLLIRGRVESDGGEAVAGVSVFAYQTDAEGIYSEVGFRRPRIRGYVRTDAGGQFELSTVRPASYPESRVQQHVHFVLAAGDGDAARTEGEIVFADDPLLSARANPGFVVCEPRRQADGAELCEVVLRLR
jgi:protocatechuate 3,4-dioxygenase beta subunit